MRLSAVAARNSEFKETEDIHSFECLTILKGKK